MNSKTIKKLAKEVGFDACGIATPEPLTDAERKLARWIQSGRHAGMKYLEQFSARAENLRQRFPEAKSIIVLGLNYFSKGANRFENLSFPHALSGNLDPRLKISGMTFPASLTGARDDRPMGRIARYAWGKDYHLVIQEKLEKLESKIQEKVERKIRFESSVDTKPFLERSLAERAGLGFIGKQTQLLSPDFGPWLFLAELITDLELEPDTPHEGTCGTCRRCIDACPTGAIDEKEGMDARKCIAYLTIEHKGEIPIELQPKIGNWVFGCDECLNVCPYTSKQKESNCEELKAKSGFGPELDLEKLFAITSQRKYEEIFKGTAIFRAKRKQLLRNASVIMANLKNECREGLRKSRK
jgi:epoxyqueuosine reductase